LHNKNFGEPLVCGHHLSRVPFKRISIYVEESLIEYASNLGGGNISLGFRKLAESNHNQDAIKLAHVVSELERLLQSLKSNGAVTPLPASSPKVVNSSSLPWELENNSNVVTEDTQPPLKHRLPELETLYEAAMNIFEENEGCLPAGAFHDKLLNTGVDPFYLKEFYETYERDLGLWTQEVIDLLTHVVLNK
jgi:hypothetical protein